MKKLIKSLTVASLALTFVAYQPLLLAQDAGAPAAEKSATADKPLPFNGTLKAVDKEAMTVEVGNRTFKLTTETKYLQGGLETAKIGEVVGGSYFKKDDGTLVVNSIRFGPKQESGE